MLPPVTAVILAGGQSRRLGVEKTRLTLGRGITLLHYTCNIASTLASEVLIIGHPSNYQEIEGTQWFSDTYPDAGALGGMLTGIERAANEHSLVLAGDMPFLCQNLLAHMVKMERSYDALVPAFDGYLEPLHAIYSRRCITHIRDLVDAHQKRIYDFYPSVDVKYLPERVINHFDPQRLSFININTIEQLAAAWILELSPAGRQDS